MKNINKNLNRESSIELLRILAMLMIILSHYSVHGGFNRDIMDFSFNKILLHISILGNVGVNIFFLISGYFLSKSKFNIKKIFKLLFQVFSYTFLIYIVLCFLDIIIFSKRDLIINTFPVIFEQYWFVSTYVLLYLISPLLNIIIDNISKKQHSSIIIVGITIFSLIYTIFSFLNFRSGTLLTNSIIMSLLLYFIGAFIQKYKNNLSIKELKKWILLTIIIILLFILLTIIACKLNLGYSYILQFYQKNSLFILFIAIGLFIIFSNIHFKSKIINIIASCTFGVYLLHDNDYIRNILWQDILKNYTYQNSNCLLIHMILNIILVFIICVIVELVRNITIQKVGNKIIDKIDEKLIKKENV